MKTMSPDRLDKATPKWPEVRITVGDLTTVTVSGVLTDVTGETEALTRTAAQARTYGRPIRARITDDHGHVRKVIVAIDGTVTDINGPAPATAPTPADAEPAGTPAGSSPITRSNGKRKARATKAGQNKSSGILDRFPARLRPVLKFGVPVIGALFLAAAVVLIIKAGAQDEPVGPPPVAVAPAVGQLYTELAPPGWTQQAAWTLALAEDAPAPLSAPDGTVVAVTAVDGSAVPVDGERFLSVLEPDGRTRWAVPLTAAPRLGPILARVDGADVALIAGTRELTYWPLAGGPETVVPLPPGARVTPSGLVELRENQLGYLQAGALTVVDTLPRTEPALAIDGAVLVSQADNGSWWTLRANQQPTAVVPAPPPGATGVERVLTVAADHVVIAWATAESDDCLAVVYDTATGNQQASAPAPCGSLSRTGATYASTGPAAGIGPLILSGDTLTVAKNATVTAVVDQVYGTTQGDPVVIAADGTITRLPDGTLIPIGDTNDHLLVVDSDNRLYALEGRAP